MLKGKWNFQIVIKLIEVQELVIKLLSEIELKEQKQNFSQVNWI